MMSLAQDAVNVRLIAATAFREACEGRPYTATELRRAFMFDTLKPLPADMLAKAGELDEP